ncbi:MAG: histidine phosphatase family protein [Desulfobacterales bacterium]
MTMLFLMRHGAIEHPEAGRFIGQTDVALGRNGRLQAEAWQDEFKSIEFTAVWSSDLSRAAETAAIVFAGHAAAVRTSRELREIHLGQWEGVPRRRVRDERPDLWETRGKDLAGFRPPGGESFRDLQRRVVLPVTRMADETPGNVCIVTHAGVIRVLICHFLDMPLSNLFRIRVDYGSLSIVSLSLERIEVCTLNLKPSRHSPSGGGNIGGLHDPAQV